MYAKKKSDPNAVVQLHIAALSYRDEVDERLSEPGYSKDLVFDENASAYIMSSSITSKVGLHAAKSEEYDDEEVVNEYFSEGQEKLSIRQEVVQTLPFWCKPINQLVLPLYIIAICLIIMVINS